MYYTFHVLTMMYNLRSQKQNKGDLILETHLGTPAYDMVTDRVAICKIIIEI